MNKAVIELSNCMDCPNHAVLPDPGSRDWFCDDDKKVVCTHTKTASRVITYACRPYNLRKESSVPNWCPLLGGSADGN